VQAEHAQAIAAHLTLQGERVYRIGEIRARAEGEPQTIIQQ